MCNLTNAFSRFWVRLGTFVYDGNIFENELGVIPQLVLLAKIEHNDELQFSIPTIGGYAGPQLFDSEITELDVGQCFKKTLLVLSRVFFSIVVHQGDEPS